MADMATDVRVCLRTDSRPARSRTESTPMTPGKFMLDHLPASEEALRQLFLRHCSAFGEVQAVNVYQIGRAHV